MRIGLEELSNSEQVRRWKSLLHSESHSGGNSQFEANSQLANAFPNTPAAFSKTEKFDGFNIIELCGRGGMGSVYKAEQRNPSRVVALKVLNEIDPEAESIRRFFREADSIAQIQHEHVLKIYEVAKRDSNPYLVLEFVDGPSLAQWLRRQPIAPRLAGAIGHKIAIGVAAAHRKGVVHRDLKPANILLQPTENEQSSRPSLEAGEGFGFIPKVADFGLAKNVDGEDHTKTNQFAGTPAYMPPEQILHAKNVGLSADVYSFGTILYEMLVGFPPFRATDPYRLLRKIETEEPARLRKENSSIPADLEAICLKCLEKNPEKRYSDAEALAADLERFIQGKPVNAKPVSTISRSLKWIKRNPARSVAVATVAIAVITGLIFWSAFTSRITRLNSDLATVNGDLKQQKKIAVRRLELANEQRAITDAVNRFLQNDLLRQAASESQIEWLVNAGMGPTTFRKDPSLTQILDRVAERIANNQTPFEDQQIVRAELMRTVGETYLALGNLKKAHELLSQAVEVFENHQGSELRLIDSNVALARTKFQLGKHDQAIALLNSAKSQLDSANLEISDEKRTLKSLEIDREIADVYVNIDNNLDKALQLAENAHRRLTDTLGEDDPATLKASITLGKVMLDLGQYKNGIAQLDSSIAIAKRKFGDQHPATIGARFELAHGYFYSLRFRKAYETFDAVWKDAITILGEDHPTTVYYQVYAAFALWSDQGRSISSDERIAKVKSQLENAQKLFRKVYPKTHRIHASVGMYLSEMLSSGGEHDRAVEIISKLVEETQALQGNFVLRECDLQIALAKAYRSKGDFERSLSELTACRTKLKTKKLEDSHSMVEVHLVTGQILTDQKKYSEAIKSLDSAYRAIVKRIGYGQMATLRFGLALLRAYVLNGDYEGCEKFASEFLETIDGDLPENSAAYLTAQQSLGVALAHQKKWKKAEAVFELTAEKYIEAYPETYQGYRFLTFRANALLAMDRTDEAEKVLLRAWDGLSSNEKSFASERHRISIYGETIGQLIRLYGMTKQPKQVEKWKAKLASFKK